jgi:hypothetical protein
MGSRLFYLLANRDLLILWNIILLLPTQLNRLLMNYRNTAAFCKAMSQLRVGRPCSGVAGLGTSLDVTHTTNGTRKEGSATKLQTKVSLEPPCEFCPSRQ